MKLSDIQVTLIDHMGSDLSVVNAARVSFNKESNWIWDEEFLEFVDGVLKPQDAKLINYLAEHKHFSPFNHTFVTMRIKAPIFVSRQLVKHEYMPINEVSRRYVDDEPEFFLPSEWRKRADNKKQGSSDEVFVGLMAADLNRRAEECIRTCLNTYDYFLARGVCPEQARMNLPLNMITEWYWSGTLKAYAKMLNLRLDPHTQYESRIVAQKVRNIIEPLFPVSVKALLND